MTEKTTKTISMAEFKVNAAKRQEAKLAELLGEYADIDASAYRVAAAQAHDINEALQASETPTVNIIIDGRVYPLHIIHTDVLNCVYVMLEMLEALPIEGGESNDQD